MECGWTVRVAVWVDKRAGLRRGSQSVGRGVRAGFTAQRAEEQGGRDPVPVDIDRGGGMFVG